MLQIVRGFELSGADHLDAAGQARNLARGGVLVNDAFLRTAHYLWLGSLQCSSGSGPVARSDGVFDLAYATADPAAAGFVDFGTADGLAGGFFC